MTRRMMQLCAGLCACVFAGAAWGYEPGDGTGLRGVRMGPIYDHGNGTWPQKQCIYRESIGVGLPHVDKKAFATLFTGASYPTSVTCWRGKLIVPETATYTFKQTGGDGDTCYFSIDGEWLMRKGFDNFQLLGGTATRALEAGEHDVELNYVQSDGRAARQKQFILEWQNDQSIAELEEIPLSQWKPADEAAMPDWTPAGLNGNRFTFGTRDSNAVTPNLRKIDDTTYWMRGHNYNPNVNYQSSFGRDFTGPFAVETEIDLSDSDDASIIVRNLADQTKSILFQVIKNWGAGNEIYWQYYFRTSSLKEDYGNAYDVSGALKGDVGRVKIRVVRDASGRIVFYAKANARPWEWVCGWENGAAADLPKPNAQIKILKPAGEADLSGELYVGVGMSGLANNNALKHGTLRNVYFGTDPGPTNLVLSAADVEGKSAKLDFFGATGPVRVQVREQGAEAWTDYGEVLPAGTTSAVVSGLASPKVYELRVVTVSDAALGVSASPTVTFNCGYGLAGSLENIEKFVYSNLAVDDCRYRETRHFQQPFVDLDDTKYIFAATNLQNALVCWRGKLVVPVAGTYTFRMLADKTASGAVPSIRFAIDGADLWNEYGINVNQWNAWGNHTYSGYCDVSAELTAGVHDFLVDWLTLAPRCTFFDLHWSRAANEATGDAGFAEMRIPQTNFLAGSESDLPVHCWDGLAWQLTGSCVYKTGKMLFAEKIGANDYSFNASKDESSIYYQAPQLLKPVSGAFSAEATFYASETEFGALTCRNGNNWVVLEFDTINDRYDFMGSRADDSNRYNGKIWKETSLDGIDAVKFRIKRRANTKDIKYYVATRDATTQQWGDYQLYATSPEGKNRYYNTDLAVLTNDVLYAGAATCRIKGQVVRDLKVEHTVPSGLVIFVR